MERLLMKAAITAATEQGTFTAVISAASIDREKDIVDPAGMVRALHKWVSTGKNIPLAWDHSRAPEHQIGYIDPKTARVKGDEVVVDGWIDQTIDAGAHAWRQVKAGTLGFSFGYLILQSAPRKGGGRLLKELDVFEVTASPTPMNNDTRVLGWKAAPDVEEGEQDTLETVVELMGDFLDTEDDDQDIASARDIINRLQQLLAAENSESPGKTVSASDLRAKADAVALEHASGGQNLAPPVAKPEPAPEPATKSLAELFAAADADVVKEIAVALRKASEPSAPEVTPSELRAKADAAALEHATGGADPRQAPVQEDTEALPDLFPASEIKALLAGEIKTAWTAAYIDDLPDSAFLFVEDGKKDADGKTTPRTLRHLPYKDASGAVDLPHLRNALARLPQSDLSQDIKDKLTAKATQILDEQKSVDGTAQAPGRAVDPLRAKAEALALEHASGGQSLQKSPPQIKQAPPPDLLPLKELKERMRAEMLTALSGGIES
jgi:hypothetical protein